MGSSATKPALRGIALRKYRVSHGLCPNCGDEAAPYYLCGSCRLTSRVIRVLKRFEAVGGVERTKQGGSSAWRMLDREKCSAVDSREAEEGDKRLAPKLGGKRVDVIETLTSLMREMGRPATVEEIVAAWGRLREKRRTASLAGDMAAIIEARRRQERKAAKRASVAARLAAVP